MSRKTHILKPSSGLAFCGIRIDLHVQPQEATCANCLRAHTALAKRIDIELRKETRNEW